MKVDELSLAWRDEEKGCLMFNVVALAETRLIASGFCGDLSNNDPVVWTSEAGRDWRWLIQEPPGTSFEGVAEDAIAGNLLMAVNTPQGPSIWRGDPTYPMDDAALPVRGNSTVRDVTWAGDRYLAVGYASLDDHGTRAVAWLGDADGTSWKEIDVPPEAASFEDVEAGATTGSFTVAGGNYQRGAISWELDAPGVWSPQQEGIADLIDSETAIAGDAVWQRQNGSWQGRRVQSHSGMDVIAGARLSDGWIVAGWPMPHSHPFMVFVARDGGPWRELPRLTGEDPAVLDMTHFADRVIGVGDAVYIGPDSVGEYR